MGIVNFIDQGSVTAFGSVDNVNNATSASFAATATSASFATTASHALFAVSASIEITKEVSSSHANTADVADGLQNNPSISVTNITSSGIISASGDISASGNVQLSGRLNLNYIVGGSETWQKIRLEDTNTDGNVDTFVLGATHMSAQLISSNFTASVYGKVVDIRPAGINGKVHLGRNVFPAGDPVETFIGGGPYNTNLFIDTALTQITSSLSLSGSLIANSTSTSSFGHYIGDGSELTNVTAPGTLSGSAQIATEISGAFGATSSSLASRISGIQLFPFTGSANISGSLQIRGATAGTGANLFEIKSSAADDLDDLFAFDDNGKVTHEVSGAGDKYIIQNSAGVQMFKFGVNSPSIGYVEVLSNNFTGAYLNAYGGAFGYGATVPTDGKSLYVKGDAQITGSTNLSGSLQIRGGSALTGANIFEVKNTSADAYDDLFAFDDNGKITHKVDGAGDKHVIQTTSDATMFKFGVDSPSAGYLKLQSNSFDRVTLNQYGIGIGYGSSPTSNKALQVIGNAQITGSLSLSGSDAIDLTVNGGLKIISSSTNTLVGLTIENQGTPASSEGYGAGIKLISGEGTAPTITGSIFVKDDSGGGSNPYHPALVLNSVGGGIYLKSEGSLQNSEMIRFAGGSSQRTNFTMFQSSGNMSHYNMVVNNGGNTSTRILMGQPTTGYYMEAGAAGSTYSYTIGTHGGNSGTFTPYTVLNTNGYQVLTNITASGNVSGSATSTASFGTYLGDGSQLTGIVTATDLSSSIFVSPSGNDTTGTVGDLMKPFKTLNSASQAATTGSTIFVYPGTYTAEAENLAFEGGSYYFHPGTVVSKSAAGPVFNSKNYSVSFNVYGHADFYLTSSCEEVIEAGNSSAPTPSFTFECQDITQLCGGDYAIIATVDNGNSTTDIAVANIKFRKLKTDGSGISLPGPYSTEKGNYFINCNEIYAEGFGIYSYQGITYLEINATRIVANGGSGIRTYYGSATNINVAYLYGSTYGFDSMGSGYITINSSYVNGINNTQAVITMNGHCADLDTSGGTFIGGSVEGGSWSGGANEIVWKPTYTETLTISGGTHKISAGSSTYFPQLNMQGGTAYVDGYNHGYYSNYRYSISGGELIWDGYLDYAIDDNGANYPFDMSGGTLRIRGYVKNQMNDSEPTPNQYSCVYYNGGNLILNGATLITSASAAPPVIVGSQDRVVKILSGGVNTNKTGSLGLLQASSSFSGDRYALTNPLGGMIIEDASVE